MYFAAVLWVTGAFPLAVTALSIPVFLTAFGVYDDIDPALVGFADHLIFLFVAWFMLASALQKYDIDRRIALWIMTRMGASPRLLIGSIMIATAFLSMWVSNTATTAMMTPIALGVLAQVLGRDEVRSADADAFTNMQIATLLGTAYAASRWRRDAHRHAAERGRRLATVGHHRLRDLLRRLAHDRPPDRRDNAPDRLVRAHLRAVPAGGRRRERGPR
jgi:di/tricarboxylate transporter